MSKAVPEEIAIEVGLDESTDDDHLRERVAKKLGLAVADLPDLTLLKRSIDARHGSVRFHLLVGIGLAATGELGLPRPRETRDRSVVIVGTGPAGLFCAYELARHGIGSVVLERGKEVRPRRRDLQGLNRRGEVNGDSNYCFGEGGAGTFSDGKLYTRAHKRGNVRDVIEILVHHGASEAILTDARPHIGSNRLPKVVTSIRETLEAVGVEFRFGARVADIDFGATTPRRIAGVGLADGTTLAAPHLVLATGHSASDIYEMLARHVQLEAKSFALGVRVEHPQPLIDGIQYGKSAGHPRLPPAAYRLVANVAERGVFSFCMCPGGFIVPAATEPGGLVLNGMSLSKRGSPYANSGLVVSVELEDLERSGFPGPLGAMALQRRLEERAFVAGGGNLRAPATRVTDFLEKRGSSTLPATSYVPGVIGSDVAEVLDGAGIDFSSKLRTALDAFGKRMRGYVTEEAILAGVETRTSAPVRIPRDGVTLQAIDVAGLYPTGEGAGYAGGIMSAAMDGMRVARAIVTELGAS